MNDTEHRAIDGTEHRVEHRATHRAAWASTDPLLLEYYDTEWGMPVYDETGIFERLSLEAFQSGLSWLIVLRKREAFRAAFAGFEPDAVAGFGETDLARLLDDPGIIRNRAKILATIANARATLRLREQGEGLAELVWSFMPQRSPAPRRDREVPSHSEESAALARELKRRGFGFVGPTTAYALMSAIGVVDAHLVSSHRRGCSGLWNPDGTRTGASPSPAIPGRLEAPAPPARPAPRARPPSRPGRMVEFIRPLSMEQHA